MANFPSGLIDLTGLQMATADSPVDETPPPMAEVSRR